MLKLSIQEQKQIIGGRSKLTVYYNGKRIIKEYFDSSDEAKIWLINHNFSGPGYISYIEQV